MKLKLWNYLERKALKKAWNKDEKRAGNWAKKGWELGQKEGWELGQKEGWKLGQKEGWDLGQKQGLRQGQKEGVETSTTAYIIDIMKKLKYTADQAMDLLSIPVENRAMYMGKLDLK